MATRGNEGSTSPGKLLRNVKGHQCSQCYINVANATEHYAGALVVVHVIHFLYSPEGGS